MNWLDIILALFFLKAVISGYQKGFWHMIARFLSLGVALWMAYLYYQPLGVYLEQKFQLSSRLGGWMVNNLPVLLAIQDERAPLILETDSLSWIDNLPVPEFFQNSINSAVIDMLHSSENLMRSPGELICHALAGSAVNIIAFLILVIGVVLGLSVFESLLGKVFEKGVLGSINRMAGILFAFVWQSIIFILLFGLIHPILSLLDSLKGEINWVTLAFLNNTLNNSKLIPIFTEIFNQAVLWIGRY